MLYGATFGGMLLGLLNSVINTRALPPELYGDFRYVTNLVQFVSSLLIFGYFTSGSRLLAISSTDADRRRIRGILCVIMVMTMLILSAVMLVMHFCARGDAGSHLPVLYMIAALLGGNVIMLNYINNVAQGDNQIGRISVARLIPSALYCVVAFIVFKKFGATPELMLTLNFGIPFVVLAAVVISTRPSFSNMRGSFHTLNEENRKYGFNVYLGSLANVSTAYIAGITLGQFCPDNSNVGFYALAVTISMPLTMLPSIIGTTFFKRFAHEDRMDPKVMKWSFLLTAATCVAYILVIRFVVDLLYDESYAVVATIAAWLSVGMSLHGLGDLFNRFLGAHGRGKELRNGAFLCGAVILVGSLVLVYFWHIKGAVITKIAGDMVYFATMYFYYRKFVTSNESVSAE